MADKIWEFICNLMVVTLLVYPGGCIPGFDSTDIPSGNLSVPYDVPAE